jgi:hypothetical protein
VSKKEVSIEELRRRAVRTPNTYGGIRAVEALAAYGEEAIPKLLEVSDLIQNTYITLYLYGSEYRKSKMHHSAPLYYD